jgi:hypothetical protein
MKAMCFSSVIVGELTGGNLSNRAEIPSVLQALPVASHAEQEEVMQFIENHRLMGKGLGYVDMHWIASAVLSGVPIWTLGKKFKDAYSQLGFDYQQTTGRLKNLPADRR